ncbi:hypothetical protein AB0878_21000 [Amycolatopsis sp. NPDC047767]|uniref:hypothetical protein n=1 Tax=Amycolatopsis sp. NPDC047767 TaxID=3156765 RepID=UPI0034543C2F
MEQHIAAAERAVAAFVARDAIGHSVVSDGVVQVVGHAAVPGYVQARAVFAAGHIRPLVFGSVEIIQTGEAGMTQSGNVDVSWRGCRSQGHYLQ